MDTAARSTGASRSRSVAASFVERDDGRIRSRHGCPLPVVSPPHGRAAIVRAPMREATDLRHGNVLDDHWQGRDRFEHRADDPPLDGHRGL
jgi:hypothetical protein